MLLDLWPLFSGPITPRSQGTYVPARTRPVVLPRGVNIHDDVGILVDQAQAVLALSGGPRTQARQVQLDDDGPDLVAVEDFRPAARYADSGVIAAGRQDLDGPDAFTSGAAAIAAADDELLMGGDF